MDTAAGDQIPHAVHTRALQRGAALSGVYYLLEDLVAFVYGVLPQTSKANEGTAAKETKRRTEFARSQPLHALPASLGVSASTQDAPRYVTAAQAAELLGIGASAVRERIKRRCLPAEKDGREWRIPLDAMLQAGGGPRYSALVLTELLAQRVAGLLRQELSSPDPEIANNHEQNELFKAISGLSERLGEEIAKREIAEREVKRLRTELAELRS